MKGNCPVEARTAARDLVKLSAVAACDAVPVRWSVRTAAPFLATEADAPASCFDEYGLPLPGLSFTEVRLTLDGGGCWRCLVATWVDPSAPVRAHWLVRAEGRNLIIYRTADDSSDSYEPAAPEPPATPEAPVVEVCPHPVRPMP
jgi:hypothetical protein